MDPFATVSAGVNILIGEDKHRVSSFRIILERASTGWSIPNKSPWLLLVIVLLRDIPSMGTELVMFVNKQVVVLAADSLAVNTGKPNEKICKIRQTGRIFWAAAGVDRDEATGFNVDTFFENNKPGPGNIGAVLDAMGNVITLALQKELPLLKARAPCFYKKLVAAGPDASVLDLFAARINGDGVEAFHKSFRLTNDKVIPEPAKTCDFAVGSRCVIYTPNKGVAEYVDSHPEIIVGNAETGIDRLMSIGQANEPGWVGPPISILAITRNGAEWQYQNNCKPIKPVK